MGAWKQRIPLITSVLLVAANGGGGLRAGAHTWDVLEMFSNADGTVQFIELWEAGGGTGEINVPGHTVTSTSSVYVIPSPALSTPTSNRSLLFATAAFAALPGAPTPDYIIPEHFFSVDGDTIAYTPYDTVTFTAGQLPTDGVQSLTRLYPSGFSVGPNAPENYAGETGNVDAGGATPPPAVPNGTVGSPMLVQMLDAAGSTLQISWDTSSCADAADHQIVYGEGSQLPASAGGTFGLAGSHCTIGTTSPFVWNTVPSAADGSGLLWWLVLATDGNSIEGSWGLGSDLVERQGPATDGSSAQCGMASKDVSNSCGH